MHLLLDSTSWAKRALENAFCGKKQGFVKYKYYLCGEIRRFCVRFAIRKREDEP